MAAPPRLRPSPSFPLSPALEGRTCADFELVVARYDEDIRWTDAYAPFRTVYNKGASDISCAFVYLPNRGHLADTILQHIVRRYDTLATTTFFCHGAINYRDDQTITPARWETFIQVDPRAAVCLDAQDLPSKGRRFGECPETFGAVYDRFFRGGGGGARGGRSGPPYQPTFTWAKGLWMSIGRSRIRRRPKEYYARMLDWVLAPAADGSEPSQGLYRDRGIYIERLLWKALTN